MNYYFGVKATDKHDAELEIIEAESLEKAQAEFAEMHPEDVKNLEYINEEDSIVNLLEKSKREEMIERLVANDISDIMQAWQDDDTEFVERVLRGEGWIGYNAMTDEQVEAEYKSREFDEEVA